MRNCSNLLAQRPHSSGVEKFNGSGGCNCNVVVILSHTLPPCRVRCVRCEFSQRRDQYKSREKVYMRRETGTSIHLHMKGGIQVHTMNNREVNDEHVACAQNVHESCTNNVHQHKMCQPPAQWGYLNFGDGTSPHSHSVRDPRPHFPMI